MAWTAPITAVAGSLFPAASYNQAVRDNLNETMPAKTTTLGSFFATSGTKQISERKPASLYIGAQSTTTSLTYTDLVDGNVPSVSVQTGTMAAVFIYCNQWNSINGNAVWMALEISGASTQAASDNFAVQFQGQLPERGGAGFLIDTLTPGLNTFSVKHRVTTSGTGNFSSRRVDVWPF